LLLQTVSFLTYLLKSFADYIRPHEESICKSIVNLLVTCSDSVSIRKVNIHSILVCLHFLDLSVSLIIKTYKCWVQELLVALKHVLGTDFKRGLFPSIDTLLEER
jgi:transformation/transcription domain-associated protein